MHCQDARLVLADQPDGDLAQSDVLELQEHLRQCPACQAYQRRQHHLDSLFVTERVQQQEKLNASFRLPYLPSGVSTERIMQAVQHQRRITEQLEDIRQQQRSRETRLCIIGPSLAIIVILALPSLPLLLLIADIVQPDLMVKTLSFLSDVVGMLIVLMRYVQAGLLLVTRNSWLLSGTALILVVMMGMWLRLMRHPRDA